MVRDMKASQRTKNMMPKITDKKISNQFLRLSENHHIHNYPHA